MLLLVLFSHYPNITTAGFPRLAPDLCLGLSLRAFPMASSFPRDLLVAVRAVILSWVLGPVAPERSILDPVTSDTKMGGHVSRAG